MMSLRQLRWGLAALASCGTRLALAAPIALTGNVETDFAATNPDVQITKVSSDPMNIGQATAITNQGWISGWAIKDIRTSYNPATDTLAVGLDTFRNAKGLQSIVGDSDGNGDPGGASGIMAAAGGQDPAHLGGRKSVAVAFAPNGAGGPGTPGTPAVIAGVPANKAAAGPGLDGFSVAAYKGNDLGLAYNFGKNLPQYQGALAFDPSARHPGLEFTVDHFSKIPGLNPTNGFWISAYAGSPDDVIAGESALAATHVPAIAEESIPEPATILAWSLVVAGAGVRARYGRKRSAVN